VEKRVFSRVEACLTVTIKHGERILQGRVENTSLKGMFVRTAEKLAEGDEVEVTLRPPEENAGPLLACRGSVVRAEPEGIAVEVHDMDRQAFAQWREIVRRHSDDPNRIEEELRGFITR
jgi:hypothetical protein